MHSARPHDKKCAKRVLFCLKESAPRLIRILAHQGYLHQWVDLHTQGALLSSVKDAEHTNWVKVQHRIVERLFA
ncbi:hypothetical protein [Holospora curviuscula]|uniref:Uncharacterized protein n=1 Tax=Holospora curviuscula TaxID=1082868 RepID=A0A2S5RDH5_9PROT|nr:hypothetical protein [Holospora curviuscula]PPE05371.1 hypothetical protein HCUR_00330 [Holospora curviuscula]